MTIPKVSIIFYSSIYVYLKKDIDMSSANKISYFPNLGKLLSGETPQNSSEFIVTIGITETPTYLIYFIYNSYCFCLFEFSNKEGILDVFLLNKDKKTPLTLNKEELSEGKEMCVLILSKEFKHIVKIEDESLMLTKSI